MFALILVFDTKIFLSTEAEKVFILMSTRHEQMEAEIYEMAIMDGGEIRHKER